MARVAAGIIVGYNSYRNVDRYRVLFIKRHNHIGDLVDLKAENF